MDAGVSPEDHTVWYLSRPESRPGIGAEQRTKVRKLKMHSGKQTRRGRRSRASRVKQRLWLTC